VNDRSRLRAALVLAGALAIFAPGPVGAQSSPAPIKYGKWALLGTSLGLNIAAAGAHQDADRIFDDIEDRCTAQPDLCLLGPGGAYLDPEIEGLYQETLRLDRRSRRYLFGGEAALLGAAVLFVWEFTRPRGRPENIPFEPEVSFEPGATRIGMRMAW